MSKVLTYALSSGLRHYLLHACPRACFPVLNLQLEDSPLLLCTSGSNSSAEARVLLLASLSFAASPSFSPPPPPLSCPPPRPPPSVPPPFAPPPACCAYLEVTRCRDVKYDVCSDWQAPRYQRKAMYSGMSPLPLECCNRLTICKLSINIDKQNGTVGH